MPAVKAFTAQALSGAAGPQGHGPSDGLSCRKPSKGAVSRVVDQQGSTSCDRQSQAAAAAAAA